MSFLPDWYSQGVQGQDSNGGFGTANMFNKPTPQQQGDFGGYLPKLINALRGGDKNPAGAGMPGSMQDVNMPQSNAMPQMTPYQDQNPIGPQMGQVNNPDTMSPNSSVLPNLNKKFYPNWNQNNGGY